VKLTVSPISESANSHPYYPLTVDGTRAELIDIVNQVILDDEQLEQESVRCNMMGTLSVDASLVDLVAWVNRHSREIAVQLDNNN